MKGILKAAYTGLSVGSLIFVLTCLSFCAANGGRMLLEWKMLAGSLAIGLGFGLPTVIYGSRRLPGWAKSLIHMTVGTAVLIAVSLICYLPDSGDVTTAVVNKGWVVLAELVVACLVWLGFTLYYKSEAKKLNRKLREKNA